MFTMPPCRSLSFWCCLLKAKVPDKKITVLDVWIWFEEGMLEASVCYSVSFKKKDVTKFVR